MELKLHYYINLILKKIVLFSVCAMVFYRPLWDFPPSHECNFLLHYLQRPPAVADEDKKDQQKKRLERSLLFRLFRESRGQMILIKKLSLLLLLNSTSQYT